MLESCAWPFANILGGCIDSLKYQNNVFLILLACVRVQTVQRNESVCDVVTRFFQLQSRVENSAFADSSLHFLPLHSNVVVLYTIGLGWLACDVFSLTPMFFCLSQTAISKETV
jgi:hypothetical protein